jgi:transcriptional/translational regulatory protein YebC/TACO1
VLAFLEVLEDHEDVQHVFSNLDVSEAALEAIS